MQEYPQQRVLTFRAPVVAARLLFIAISLVATAETHPQDTGQRKPGTLVFEPYKLKFENQEIDAELGRLTVKENRANPKSNHIELAFVRLKSTAQKPGYPVIYLDGGPGSSAINVAQVTKK